MPTDVRMPQLGESVHEGTLGKWLKQPGEAVAKYEPLVEVITDKVNVEMPSPYAGVLHQIVVQEGQTVTAGTVIATIQESGAAAKATAPAQPAVPPQRASAEPSGAPGPTAAAPVQPAPPPQRVSAEPSGAPRPAPAPPPSQREAIRLTPLVRRIAEEHGLGPQELERISGSGTGGRITREDVQRYLETRDGARTAPADGAGGTAARPAPASGPEIAAAVPPAGRAMPGGATVTPAPSRAPGDEVVPFSVLRRTIAERMARSKREIPHAYGVIEVDVTSLVRHRETHKNLWRSREGVNVTFTAFIVRAVSRALRDVPAVNSSFTPEGVLRRRAVNIGVGVAIPDGLIVPVIKDADQKSVTGLARDLDTLTVRARSGKLTLDDVSGGTFTITNPGVFGSVFSMPVINHPQAAILSADAVVRRPVVIGDGIAIRDIMHLGLGFDHRVFDGAVAMQFLNHIKHQLETFVPTGDSPEF